MKSYKELISTLQESEPKQGKVETKKYSWGTMKTVHHGADFSIPLHPEHHHAISKLKDEQEHKFKDETGRHWVARRKGEHVHFDTTGNGSMKTHVPMHTMHEEYINEELDEETHSELARQAASKYRTALARGDSVAAAQANAERVRHKKAAEITRKKSHIPGEMDEAYESPLDTPAQKKAREDLKKTLLDIKKKNPNHPATKDIKESHVEFRIDHRDKVTGDHKPTFADHEAKVSDTTDKATYVKVPSHKADSFKSAMKSKHGVRVELAEEVQLSEAKVTDLDDYFDKIEMKGVEAKKAAPKKEPENTITGSQIKFFNNFKEELELAEKMNLAKSDMGDVIKDFQKSDAPQFAGKSKEKKRQMAIAAKLEADRQQNEAVIQPTGDDSMDTGADNKGKTTYTKDKTGKLISFKHESEWKKSTGTITDKGGAKHTPMSQARHLARSAMKTVKEEIENLEEELSKMSTEKLQKHWDSHKDEQNPSPVFANQLKRVAAELKKRKTVKEDLDEAFVNGREYASQGVMHPDHAKMGIHQKTGNTIDFYAHGTGDKIPGKVTKNDGKEVHIRATNGTTHKFKVTPHLPKQQNEEMQLEEGSDHDPYFAAQKHKESADKAHQAGDNKSYHMFMAAHHDSMAEWSAKRGRHHVAAQHEGKAQNHEDWANQTHKEEFAIDEQAPVAPVPGQKWKDHAVMVNGKQRVVIHRKHIGNYSKEEGWKEVAPGQKVKESFDDEGNLVSEKLSYAEMMMMLEYTPGPGGVTRVQGRSYGSQYHDPEGDDDADDKPAKKAEQPKKGRGRPAGSKSGANVKRLSSKGSNGYGYDSTGYKLHLPNTNK